MKIRATVPSWKKSSSRKTIPLDIRELENLQVIPGGIDYSQFSNESLLRELEGLYLKAEELLESGENENVWDIFRLFFERDLDCKMKIARALMPESEDEILPEDELAKTIELQGFYSNFRIRIIESIVKKLIHKYDLSTNYFLNQELDEGGRLAMQAQAFYRFFTVHLKVFEAPMDEYKGAMFYECMMALEVVKESGERNLREMTESITRAEHVERAKAESLLEKSEDGDTDQ